MVCPLGISSVLSLFIPGAIMLARDGRLRLFWNSLLFGNPLGWLVYYRMDGGPAFRIALEVFFVLTLVLCASRVAWLHWVEARPLPGHERFGRVAAALSLLFQDRIVFLLKGLLLGFLLMKMLGTVPQWPEILIAGGILLSWICLLLLWQHSLAEYVDRIWLYKLCQTRIVRTLFARRHANLLLRQQVGVTKRCPLSRVLVLNGGENGY